MQIKLFGRLQRHRPHGRALDRLGNGLGIAVVVLVSFEKRLHVLGRQQAHVMAKGCELAPNMMSPGAGLHSDQTDRQVGQAGLQLPARDLAAQQDLAAGIHANQVESILAQVDADRGDGLSRGLV